MESDQNYTTIIKFPKVLLNKLNKIANTTKNKASCGQVIINKIAKQLFSTSRWDILS